MEWHDAGPVLVGTDLTVRAEEALRQGAALARDLDSTLTVCHVMPELLRVAMLFPQFRGENSSLLAEMTGRARDAVQRELSAILGAEAASVDIAIDSGTAHVGLLAQADSSGAAVIVTGPGDTATEVVRHAAVPVLVARTSPRGPVVAATDLSAASTLALKAAGSEAARRHAPLHIIHVLDVGSYALGAPPADAPPYLQGASVIALDGLDEMQADATRRLHATLQDLDVEGQVAVVPGHAAPAIVSYAESIGAALVVVGTHGRSAFARLSLGSTAADVVDLAPCSVLVVRTASAAVRS